MRTIVATTASIVGLGASLLLPRSCVLGVHDDGASGLDAGRLGSWFEERPLRCCGCAVAQLCFAFARLLGKAGGRS